MNTTAEVHEVGIVARRADGATIRAGDVLDYLDSVRVAAGVIDGARVGDPQLHTVRMALDPDGLVQRSDDLPATLAWQGLVRSLVHRFDTLAVVDDGVVDERGRHHDADDLPEELEKRLDALPEARAVVAVHALRTDPVLDVDARLVAIGADDGVEHTAVDGFTVIRDLSISPSAHAELADKDQLPSVSLRRDGESMEALVRARSGRRVVECHVASPAAPELPDGLTQPEVRAALLGGIEVSFHSRHTFDPDTVARLEAAGAESASFAHDVVAAVGVPAAVATWFDGGDPPGPVDIVGPTTVRATMAHVGRVIVADMREEAVKGPLGRFRRFLIDHPLVTLLYGTAQLAAAIALLAVVDSSGVWTPVRWIFGLYLAGDGLMSLTVAVTTWHGRRRARVRA